MASKEKKDDYWTTIIKPSRSLWSLNLKEIWEYRDLIFHFVKRDLVSIYKQTILGPLWILLQPLFTSLTFTLIFGKLAGFSTGERPPILFYLSGVIIWTFFSETLQKTSSTFITNANIFGKVYFPRMVMPLSVFIGNFINFLVQLVFFLSVYIYFILQYDLQFMNSHVVLVPLLILLIGLISLGFGIIISSLTTKYRDLRFLIVFAVQLLMYLTPVIYQLQSVPEDLKAILVWNPLTPIMENFRYAFLSTGIWDWNGLLYSSFFTLGVMVFGLLLFNRVEKNFLDTI